MTVSLVDIGAIELARANRNRRQYAPLPRSAASGRTRCERPAGPIASLRDLAQHP